LKNFKNLAVLFTALMLASVLPTGVTAASSLEITTSIQSSLDKTIAANQAQASKIHTLYNEFLTLQNQVQDWEIKINTVHTGNEQNSAALSKQIKEIDAANLDKLEAAVAQTRERYKPLFSHYNAVNKQIEAARLLKNKELSSMLRFQAGVIRIPVQLARMDIKNKEEASRAAKDKVSKTVKKIRSTLDDIDPVNVQIKAKKSAIKTTEASITPIWSAFKQSVKKEEVTGVLSSLTSLVSLIRQINDEQQKVYKLETKIGDIIAAAKTLLP
jgi:hypothetical protein